MAHDDSAGQVASSPLPKGAFLSEQPALLARTKDAQPSGWTSDDDPQGDVGAETAQGFDEEDLDEDDGNDDDQDSETDWLDGLNVENIDFQSMDADEFAQKFGDLLKRDPKAAQRYAVRQAKLTKEHLSNLDRERELQKGLQELRELREQMISAQDDGDTDEADDAPFSPNAWIKQFEEREGRQPTDVEFMDAAIENRLSKEVKKLEQRLTPIQDQVVTRYINETRREFDTQWDALSQEFPSMVDDDVKAAIATDLINDASVQRDGITNGTVRRSFFKLYGDQIITSQREVQQKARTKQAQRAKAPLGQPLSEPQKSLQDGLLKTNDDYWQRKEAELKRRFGG